MNAEDERLGTVTGILNRLNVVDIPANLLRPWKAAAGKLEDADLMSDEQLGGHAVAKPFVSTENDPPTRASVGSPDIIIKLLFSRAVHRP